MKRLTTFSLALLLYSFAYAQQLNVSNIGQRTFDFKDESRNRPVVTELWYPTSDTLRADDKKFSPFLRNYTVRNAKFPQTKLPLIMLSHGTGGGRLTMEWLAQGLAKSGFIVAAVDHWGNTFDNKIAIEFVKPWERPLDISFALTSLLRDHTMKDLIDQKRIGSIGFSFGGYTVIALAGGEVDLSMLRNYYKTIGKKEFEIPEYPNLIGYLDDSIVIKTAKKLPRLKDARIKAFFAISPALGGGFADEYQVKNITALLYITGLQSDSVAPVKSNAQHFHRMIHHSNYYEFPGDVGHYLILSEAIKEVKESDPIYFQDQPSVDRHQVHEKVKELAIRFFSDKL